MVSILVKRLTVEVRTQKNPNSQGRPPGTAPASGVEVLCTSSKPGWAARALTVHSIPWLPRIRLSTLQPNLAASFSCMF